MQATPEMEASLKRRLERVAALPPSQITPDMEAFKAAMVLAAEVSKLLPLDQSGAAALPTGTPEARRSALLAMLKVRCF